MRLLRSTYRTTRSLGTPPCLRKISNQLLAGVNYFRQIFSDFNTNFNLASYGLNLYDGFNLPGRTEHSDYRV